MVDYSLRIGDANLVFIEAKAGSVDLKNCESQVEDYCRATKPSLAVLTNGYHWWLYLPPLTRPKNATIRRFLEFDINDEPREVESNFRQFLARDKMANERSIKATVDAAKVLFDEKRKHAAVMKGLIDAWNELSTNEQALACIVSTLAERRGIQPTDAQVQKFIHSKVSLVNPVPDSDLPKGKVKKSRTEPASFTLWMESEEVVRLVETWADVLVSVSELMSEHHPDDFRRVLEIEGPFKKPFEDSSQTFKKCKQIGSTGIYVNLTSRPSTVKTVCDRMLGMFKYQADGLTIEEV